MNLILGAVTVVLQIQSSDQELREASEKTLRAVLSDGVVLELRADVAAKDEPKQELRCEISWNAGGTGARLRLWIPGKNVLERSIALSKEDLPKERGRTAAFVLATMFPVDAVSPQRLLSETARKEDSRVEARGSESAESRTPLAKSGAPESPTPKAPAPSAVAIPTPSNGPVLERNEPSQGKLPPSFSRFEVAGFGSASVAGSASTFGGGLSARYFFTPAFAVGISGTGRWGSVEDAQAHSQQWSAFGYGGLRTWLFKGRLGLGGRVGVGTTIHTLSRTTLQNEVQSKSRGVPAACFYGEALWRWGDNVGFFIGIGSELALGKTGLFVDDLLVAEIPIARMVGEVGLSVHF